MVSYLFGTVFAVFGCVVAMSSSLPLIIQRIFAQAPGGAPYPLFWPAIWAGAATVVRPLGVSRPTGLVRLASQRQESV